MNEILILLLFWSREKSCYNPFLPKMLILVSQQDKMEKALQNFKYVSIFYSVLQPHFNKYFKHPNVNWFGFYTTSEISGK